MTRRIQKEHKEFICRRFISIYQYLQVNSLIHTSAVLRPKETRHLLFEVPQFCVAAAVHVLLDVGLGGHRQPSLA